MAAMTQPLPGLPTPRPDAQTREIPFNYTSADDRQAMSLLLGSDIIATLDSLRERRVTGRSARLLMRFFGEILIHRRNPYLFQELLDSPERRQRMVRNAERALDIIERSASGEPEVLQVLAASRALLADFRREVREAPRLRRRMLKALAAVVGAQNVAFDPFSLVSHATDATDWRLHLPAAVVTPEQESQVAPLLRAIARLGLKAIPRGAGTGLTGGAVPLRPGCVMINSEKLDRIRGLVEREFQLDSGAVVKAPAIEVETGVVTEKAMEYARERGLVFATDPTSSWASTIGGNIAENAGGKLAVRWGTCIDNLLAWRMAMPNGQRWTVRRTNHALRKILPEDLVRFEVEDEQGQTLKVIELRGSDIRKKGLWKDITNKALGGVPGLQKEGTDGVITSAEFVLYPEYPAKRTLCLEFFGEDMDEASRAILDLSRAFPFADNDAETLLSLEHFDDEYVRAIDYRVKAVRAETPKAVLLIDVAGHSEEQAARGAARVRAAVADYPNTEVFEAQTAEEAQRYWADRKKLGAIARRTNAFKLNEDVVIPLEALAEFARFVDDTNVEEERYAQQRFLERAEALFLQAASDTQPGSPAAKAAAALTLCEQAQQATALADAEQLRRFGVLNQLRRDLGKLFSGYPELLAALDRAHAEVRDRRIVLATHMHAGDGNVHVNVPVLSNDRAMLDRAGLVIDRVMDKVVELGGVVSGEHGIGVTKLKYLEREKVEQLAAYRREVDPEGLMNPGKLEDYAALDRIFTPSFNLLELEARILRHGRIEELSRSVSGCIRCGKCKPDCCVFHPAQGLFYHPRNKNLAVGALIEALLYDAQRERSTHFELLQWLEEVADHCTICHKCAKPCPVDIDTGVVSVLERRVLDEWGYKRTPVATKLTLDYLDSRSPTYNRAFRSTVLRFGMSCQGIAAKLAQPFQPKDVDAAPYAMRLLRSPMPTVPALTLRDVAPQCEPDQVLVFEPAGEARATVFYFPGCGSERMVSTIAMAAVHVLLELGTRVVLPPPYLCCGFPFEVNAKAEAHSRIVLRDTIIFNQIRAMFAHLDFDACIVSCGTCRDGLGAMEADRTFGARLVDIAQFAQEQGLRLEGAGGYLYHTPCHDSLGGKALDTLGKLGGFGTVAKVPNCCSEAGTLSLSRPDISDKMRHRKRDAIAEANPERTKTTLLTNCPSCVQGLGRNRDLGVAPRHIAVELAEKLSGKDWVQRFRGQAAAGVAFTF
jgi:FAD/FMN-containing dehydrogenase/Fe-S oxidoreductase